jgi:hypothetical protein
MFMAVKYKFGAAGSKVVVFLHLQDFMGSVFAQDIINNYPTDINGVVIGVISGVLTYYYSGLQSI